MFRIPMKPLDMLVMQKFCSESPKQAYTTYPLKRIQAMYILSYIVTEHPEPDLTGNHKPVLHIHYYDRNLKRTNAAYLDYETFKKYEKYLVGRKWYND